MRRSYRGQVQSIRHAPLRYHPFELFSRCRERGAGIVTGHLPFAGSRSSRFSNCPFFADVRIPDTNE